MLLEFDADQRLWQETVRDVVAKQCPPTLVRGVAEDGVDPTPVWKAYVEHGWTEMSDPETAVELAIVLEELGRATDPTPFLATMAAGNGRVAYLGSAEMWRLRRYKDQAHERFWDGMIQYVTGK